MNRTLRGTVVHGQGLGHRFGFPTANLKVEAGTALPPRGVYASEAVIDGRRYAGVTNIGARPTVTDSPEVTIETFFIDYEGDLYGRELRGSLVREKINTDGLLTSEAATGFAVIMLEGADNRILVFAGANHALHAEDVLPAFNERPDAVLLQLEIPFDVVCAVCHEADRLGIPAIVDLGPAIQADFSRLGRVEILSPNRSELANATGMSAETDEELLPALNRLAELVPCKYIVLKDGGRGAALYENGVLTRFPTYDVSPIVDTTGAGDAFTAALTLRYVETGDIRAAIDRGNAAGSLAITKLGAQNGMPDAAALDALQARGHRA